LEPTNPAFELAKTVHALDRAATVIGPNPLLLYCVKYSVSRVACAEMARESYALICVFFYDTNVKSK
jgi:hypothetical protein